LIRLRSVT